MIKTVKEWCYKCQEWTLQRVAKPFGQRITTRWCLVCGTTLEKQFDKINLVSEKQKKINDDWKRVTIRRFINVGGRCEDCGLKGDWRNLSPHHKIKRRFKINTYENCRILCGKCHAKREGIKEV